MLSGEARVLGQGRPQASGARSSLLFIRACGFSLRKLEICEKPYSLCKFPLGTLHPLRAQYPIKGQEKWLDRAPLEDWAKSSVMNAQAPSLLPVSKSASAHRVKGSVKESGLCSPHGFESLVVLCDLG